MDSNGTDRVTKNPRPSESQITRHSVAGWGRGGRRIGGVGRERGRDGGGSTTRFISSRNRTSRVIKKGRARAQNRNVRGSRDRRAHNDLLFARFTSDVFGTIEEMENAEIIIN